jgi:hypothetical protein
VLATVLASLATPVVAANAGSVCRLYLSSTGSDANDGKTVATAVRTVARAQQLLKALAPTNDVEIRIKQGTYVAPQTDWDFFVPGRTVSFMPIDYEVGEDASGIAGRPVLRGNGTAGVWLHVRLPAGHPGGATNLRFYYLHVERYSSGGLVLNGGVTTNASGLRVPASAGLNHNTVYGMMFLDLGSKHAPASAGYSGLTPQNSSDNYIRNNHFVRLENTGDDAALVHGIYLAHWSRRNTVVSNRFESISGAPMRVRNDSNDNNISGNVFERTGQRSHYDEWFCDAPCVANNPGHPRECASHGNVFHHNDIRSGYTGGDISVWALQPPGIDYPGGAGCHNAGQWRLRTYGNT